MRVSTAGRIGGRAGTGKAKRRGGAAYYRKLAARAHARRRENYKLTATDHRADAKAKGGPWDCDCVACRHVREAGSVKP